jgi:hypothetical protein
MLYVCVCVCVNVSCSSVTQPMLMVGDVTNWYQSMFVEDKEFW